MDVSVIFVNYNTLNLLVNAIDSVFSKTEGIKYEIIVIDNNSTDDSKNILFERYGNKINCVFLSENIGFGRANNEAIKIAKGRNIFLLNPDTILINNAIKILSDYLDNDPSVGVCGGNLYDENFSPMHSYTHVLPSIFAEINFLFLNLPLQLLYGKSVEFNTTNKPMEVAYITGADMMLKSDVLRNVGFFDEDFFMYYEETELTYRIKQGGYKVISVPNAKIIHLESKSFSYHSIKQKMMLYGRYLYYKKLHSKIYYLFANVIFLLNCLIRIVIYWILNDKTKKLYWSSYFQNLIKQKIL